MQHTWKREINTEFWRENVMERDYYLEAIKSTCYMPMQAQDPATLPYRESAPVPILQETGWAPQAVWRGTERRKSLAPTRVQNWTIQSIASNHRYSDKNIKIDFFLQLYHSSSYYQSILFTN